MVGGADIRCIRHLLYDLPTNVRCFHVYGHEDDDDEYLCLSKDAQLNVLCDKNAKAFLRTQIDKGIQQHALLTNEIFAVSMGGI